LIALLISTIVNRYEFMAISSSTLQLTEPIISLSILSEQRRSLVLRAWEVISAEREPNGVLASIVDVLLPHVPIYSVAAIVPGRKERGPYAFHVVGDHPCPGDNVETIARRGGWHEPQALPVRPAQSREAHEEMTRRAGLGEPYSCADIWEKEAWYFWEYYLATAGIRAYASVPLPIHGRVIGVAVFGRNKPLAFTAEELELLGELARPIAVSISNAIAWEELTLLRDQLTAENVELRAQLQQDSWIEGIIGRSSVFKRVMSAVEQVAPTDATVLLTGETGTGKELIARAIHHCSRRAHSPLIKFNCASVPDALLASELFGHERGAFTGAHERRRGRFEQAHQGTLFLDEVGELSLEMQALLLRVLQEGEFERLGGSETVRVNVRIIAATNRDLAEEVRAGRFRRDLYYRLNIFPLRLPSLRERLEDVPMLAAHFAHKHGARFGRTISRIDKDAFTQLCSYDWPGNVRELENVIERAVILSNNGTLRIGKEMLEGIDLNADLTANLENEERAQIETALRAARGRVAGPHGAARRLGLPPSTLDFRIKRLGIDKYQYRRR
jgi:formate hydrogenlyase transcriptional activator